MLPFHDLNPQPCLWCCQIWFTQTRGHVSFVSPPLQLHKDMLELHGGLEQQQGGSGSGGGSRSSNSSTAKGVMSGAAADAAQQGNGRDRRPGPLATNMQPLRDVSRKVLERR